MDDNLERFMEKSSSSDSCYNNYFKENKTNNITKPKKYQMKYSRQE